MAAKKSFEENLEIIDSVIKRLEDGDISLDESIKEYELAMKCIDSAEKILEKAEGKVRKIVEKDGELIEKNF